MAGNVAHEKIQMIGIEGAHETEVAANRAHRKIERFHVEAAPDERFRREALLHASSEGEVFFNFFLPLFEEFVRGAQLLFGAFLLGNIGKTDDREGAAVGVFQASCAGNHRQLRSAFCRQVELMPGPAHSACFPAPFANQFRVFRPVVK